MAGEPNEQAVKAARTWEAAGDPKSLEKTSYEVTETDALRMRDAFIKMGDEYICPITLQFPLHPVVAEDGRMYEREAIEEWFSKQAMQRETHDGMMIKSPHTGLYMKMGLIPANQVRNAIEHGIQGGMFIGDRANVWLEKKKKADEDSAKVRTLELHVKDGDKDSAHALSKAYSKGWYSLPKDDKKALEWAQKAADMGHAFAATQVGLAYQSSKGPLEKCNSLAMAYLMAGAVLGSECGCYQVAGAYEIGRWGFPQDLAKAAYWYRRMESAPIRDAGKHNRREKAANFLEAHAEDGD